MKKHIGILIAISTLFFAYHFFDFDKKASLERQPLSSNGIDADYISETRSPGTPFNSQITTPPGNSLTKQENVKKFIKNVLLSPTNNLNEETVHNFIANIGGSSATLVDRNAYTGERHVLSLTSKVVGIPFVEAEFFLDDKNQKPIPHNFTIVFDPNSDAFENMPKALNQVLPKRFKVSKNDPNFKQWSPQPGYTLWSHKIDRETLANNPELEVAQVAPDFIQITLEIDQH